MFVPPIPLIRRMRILRKLEKAGAYSEETAKPLHEIGLINPYAFQGITKRLLKKEVIKRTDEGKYYINTNL